MRSAVSILAFLLTTGDVNAASELTGNDVYEYCRKNDRAYLNGFVNGVHDKSVMDAQVLIGLYLHMLPKDQAICHHQPSPSSRAWH